MNEPRQHFQGDRDPKRRVYGDPGVGGLLADPQEPAQPHEEPDPDAGPASPDPDPPRHHGDWIVPRKETARLRPGPQLAAIMRRKSRSGMPRALFREDDGTSLDDLKALRLAYRHHYALRPLAAGRATIPRNSI